jgi:hypothetical protein
MARKKTRKTTRSRRRRSVGATGKINAGNLLTQIGGVLAGVAAAGYVNKLALSSQSDNVKAIVPIALGIATPAFLLKSDFGKALGAGMIAYGGNKFLQKAGLAGLGADDDMSVTISGDDLSVVAGADDYAIAGDYAMAGDEQISVLAGTEDLNEMAGFEADEEYNSSI